MDICAVNEYQTPWLIFGPTNSHSPKQCCGTSQETAQTKDCSQQVEWMRPSGLGEEEVVVI